MIEEVAKNNPQEIGNLLKELFSEEAVELEEIPLKGQDKDPYTQYFYALIAMEFYSCIENLREYIPIPSAVTAVLDSLQKRGEK